MAASITANEQEQILQTIEMFEVISEMNPDDYQSLALLREAYTKLNRSTEATNVACRMVEAYMRLDQLHNAQEEMDRLLDSAPDNPRVQNLHDALRDLIGDAPEPPASEPPQPPPPDNAPGPPPDTESHTDLPNGFSLDFSAMASEDTLLSELPGARLNGSGSHAATIGIDDFQPPEDDGLDPLADFLRSFDLADRDSIDIALSKTRSANQNLPKGQVAHGLLQEIFRLGTVQAEEDILLEILNHTKLGFAPIEHYEVDRQIVKMLPEEITLHRLFLPFELISRTVMIATSNPFDAPGKAACQSLLDYNIKWFFARPSAIDAALRNAYRIPKPE